MLLHFGRLLDIKLKKKTSNNHLISIKLKITTDYIPATEVYQGVLGMVLLVSFWEIFN